MVDVHIRASREYDVTIGAALLDGAGERIRALCSPAAAAIVCGDNVWPLYGEYLVRSLERAGIRACVRVIPHGERHKNIDTFADLLSFFAQNGIGRGDVVVALGGGVTLDLAGFAAACYMRGVALVHMPTTLLAAVDAAVGGKTAIDLPEGKNLAGCFYQPTAVLCDTDTLSTLPEREYRCGCAEVIKYAVLFDAELFDFIEKNEISGAYGRVITRCVELKRDTVELDEFDRGERQLLNLGHSIGHAIERCSGYAVPHGKAVAAGMAMIARAAAARGICPQGDCDRIISLLRRCALPTGTDFGAEELAAAMCADKKRQGETLRLVVPQRIGKCAVTCVPTADIRGWLTDGGAR